MSASTRSRLSVMHGPRLGAAVFSAALLLGCSADVEAPTGSSGVGGQGGASVGPGTVTAGSGGSSQGGAGQGGGPACKTFGDACTECAAQPTTCAGPYCGCLGDPACATLWQCFLACPNDDAACVDACELDQPEGYAAFLGMVDCLGTSCSAECGGAKPLAPCAGCWVDSCAGELDACIGDPSCNAMIDCLGGCSTAACVSDCYQTAPDKTAADALFTCSAASCDMQCGGGGTCQGLGDACTDCAFASPTCETSYCDCFASPDCSAYASCVGACMATDEPCHDACELANAQGYSAFYRMADCMGAECSQGCGFGALPPCFTCLVSTCSAQTDACEGDLACNEWLDCTSACNDGVCLGLCYAALSDTTLADAFVACFQGPCGAECGGGGPTTAAGQTGSGMPSAATGMPASGVSVGTGFVTVGAGP